MRLFFTLFGITLFLSSCQSNNEEISLNGTSPSLEKRNLPVINEILFDPLQKKDDGVNDQPDFVEIYNPGTETVDLYGWHIQDCPASSGSRYTYHFADDPSSDNLLAPGQYGVIVPEETLDREASRLVNYYDYLSGDATVRIFIVQRKTFSLNNDTDCVTLKDSDGTVIDSVAYSSTWHNPYSKNTKGVSLEKFNDQLLSNSPSSWSSSMDIVFGGTPGRHNSIYLPENRLEQTPSLRVTPESFSPDLNGTGDKASIRYSFPAGAYQVAVTIYDSSGKAVRTLAEGLPSGPEGMLEWNGLENDNSPALSGIYLVRVSATGTAFNGTVQLEENVALVR
ncbi:MAG: hypothetical protein C1941_03880 [Prosthecochloris sp.]|nr:hypothetical protein [Prosthecochloris sp.]